MTITREDVLWRTNHVWAEGTVPYSMSAVHQPDGYRADCSGYVSMCWMTGPQGGSTVTLVDDGVMYQIHEDDLLPGDAVGQCGPGTSGAYGHIQLFEGWDGSGFWVWEQTGGGWGPHHNYFEGRPSWYGYEAWRYINIEGEGMGERDAQLAASYATTGSDQNGPVVAPEAWSIINYSTKAIEERLNAKIAELGATLDYQTRRVNRMGRLLQAILDRLDDRDHDHPHPRPHSHDLVEELRPRRHRDWEDEDDPPRRSGLPRRHDVSTPDER